MFRAYEKNSAFADGFLRRISVLRPNKKRYGILLGIYLCLETRYGLHDRDLEPEYFGCELEDGCSLRLRLRLRLILRFRLRLRLRLRLQNPASCYVATTLDLYFPFTQNISQVVVRYFNNKFLFSVMVLSGVDMVNTLVRKAAKTPAFPAHEVL